MQKFHHCHIYLNFTRMDFLECKVCHVPYNEDNHRPRNAPCGHELCTACIQGIIKDDIYMCPKCRQKHIVKVPEDLPVCFVLIDAIRAFKAQNISLLKETKSTVTGTTNDEVCDVHNKNIGHWCFKCQLWICVECLESHNILAGCSTATLVKAMEDMKEKQSKNIEMLLTTFEEDTKKLTSKSQELKDKRHELLKKAEQCGEEIDKIKNSLEQGNSHKERLIESRKNLISASTRQTFSERMKMATQRKQLLHSWSVKNLGTNTPLDLLKELKEDKAVYVEMVIKNETRHAKLSQHEKSFNLHPFIKQTVSDGSKYMHFERLQQEISEDAPLVFIELTLGNTIKGCIRVRLNKTLPNTSEHIVHIVTGQKGPSMKGVTLSYSDTYGLCNTSLPFSDI
ncbi:unnamed protein product [Meganyctiphanes norvegica]|uniref:RING-type domain-containing protein n=1 Tax=Meganyctiphanes norvegica TaxID=48144 RepID=A0AAV2R7A8_MEGNR